MDITKGLSGDKRKKCIVYGKDWLEAFQATDVLPILAYFIPHTDQQEGWSVARGMTEVGVGVKDEGTVRNQCWDKEIQHDTGIKSRSVWP